MLLSRLNRCGFSGIERQQIFSSLSAARRYVERQGLRPMLMLGIIKINITFKIRIFRA